jgi:hypothetical protein
MLGYQEETQVNFEGTAKERSLARRLFSLLRTQGQFMSRDSVIRVSVSSISTFLERLDDAPTVNGLLKMIAANPNVFLLEEVDGESFVSTTADGAAPSVIPPGVSHSFAQRFMTPQPKPERPAQPVRERPRIDPSWASLPSILEGLGPDEEEELDILEHTNLVAAAADEAALDLSSDETEVSAGDEQDLLVADVEPPVAEPVVARTITLPIVPSTDVTGVDDLDLAGAVRARLQGDLRVANFGDFWMMEDRVPRFSRNDLRRLKDYIQEQEQPLTDDVLVQDVLGVRPGTQEFDLTRFAINVRLAKEHREFDFVGTSNQRFWSTTNLPQIGTTRRKPNEIGTDYRYLLDEETADVAPRSAAAVDHVLTFYEYEHGLLPYDVSLKAVLPAAVEPTQRSSVLTFETPQSYTTYLVELRYPTPNRGGFILGLDDFYAENLVPGAVLSINRTENDGHYLVEYLKESNQQGRLLELDERRAQRYVFRPTTYACGVDPAFLLTEERFPRLASEKPLDEKARRRPEAAVAATFERVGEQREGGYWSSYNGLFAAVNIERPFSERLLRSILDKDDSGAFSRDPDGADAYTYVPGGTP